MLFWYLGAGCVLLLVTLGPRRIDYRLALAGLVLPLVDVPIRLLVYGHSRLGVHLYAHTFVFALAVLLVIQLTLRGGRARTWFVVPMAVVVHLLLAGMLGDPIGLFWPLLSTHFTRLAPGARLLPLVLPVRGVDVLKEAAGLAALGYIALAFGLNRPGPRRRFLTSGALSSRRLSPGEDARHVRSASGSPPSSGGPAGDPGSRMGWQLAGRPRPRLERG